MIDLHCHILPGVDDGSSSEEESCRMARLAVESGVTAVCATPHCNVPGCFDNYRTEALEERFLRLARLLRERDIPLRLYAGMEVYVTPETPRHLREGKAGWALQINKGSLFGRFGRRAARTAHWCLGEGCMHLIGSDAHSPYRRTPWLEDARSYVAEYTAPEIADFLLEENPRRMLENAPIRPVLAQF